MLPHSPQHQNRKYTARAVIPQIPTCLNSRFCCLPSTCGTWHHGLTWPKPRNPSSPADAAAGHRQVGHGQVGPGAACSHSGGGEAPHHRATTATHAQLGFSPGQPRHRSCRWSWNLGLESPVSLPATPPGELLSTPAVSVLVWHHHFSIS